MVHVVFWASGVCVQGPAVEKSDYWIVNNLGHLSRKKKSGIVQSVTYKTSARDPFLKNHVTFLAPPSDPICQESFSCLEHKPTSTLFILQVSRISPTHHYIFCSQQEPTFRPVTPRQSKIFKGG